MASKLESSEEVVRALKEAQNKLETDFTLKEQSYKHQIDKFTTQSASESKLFKQMESSLKAKEEYDNKCHQLLKSKDEKLDEIQDKLEDHKDKIKKLNKEYDSFKQKLSKSLEEAGEFENFEELQKVKELVDKYVSLQSQFYENKQALEQESKKLNQQNQTYNKKIKELTNQNSTLEEQMKVYRKQIEILESDIKEKENEISELKKEQQNKSTISEINSEELITKN